MSIHGNLLENEPSYLLNLTAWGAQQHTSILREVKSIALVYDKFQSVCYLEIYYYTL